MTSVNAILEKSYQFGVIITKFCRSLIEKRKEYIISSQLLRSGTSIGSMVEEAQSAESKKDFIHKMTIALKEARETRYWLRILCDSDIVAREAVEPFLQQSTELIALLIAITKSAKKNNF